MSFSSFSLNSQTPKETDNVVYDLVPVSVYFPPDIKYKNPSFYEAETHHKFIAYYPNMFPSRSGDEKAGTKWSRSQKFDHTIIEVTSASYFDLEKKLSLFNSDKSKKTTICSRKRKSTDETFCCCLKLSGSMEFCETCSIVAKRSRQVSDDDGSTLTVSENMKHENQGLLSAGDWMIKKVFTQSDVNGSCRLLILKSLVKKHILPRLEKMQFDKRKGLEVPVCDTDTQKDHVLKIIKWSTNSYVLKKNWSKEFVIRRALEDRDEVGFRTSGGLLRISGWSSVFLRGKNNPFLIAPVDTI